MSKVATRVFVVGCPRSGTTLLQSFIAAHPEMHSWSETNMIPKVALRRQPFREFGIVHPRAKAIASGVLKDVGLEQYASRLPSAAIFTWQYARALREILDADTVRNGKVRWVEKSPLHVRHVPALTKGAPDARFVHIVRDGRDVVASLRHNATEYGGHWRKYLDLDRCIREWTGAVNATLAYVGKPGHYAVNYDRLTTGPLEDNLRTLCEFLGIDFRDSMITGRAAAVGGIVHDREGWKKPVSEDVKPTGGKRFQAVFSKEEQQYVLQELEKRVGSSNPSVS